MPITDSQDSTSDEIFALPNAPPGSDFVQLFTRGQRRLFLFILSHVPNPIEAEEILQETNVVIWTKCDRFQMGTNFLAWACQIANYEILKYRDRCRRDKLCFSDEFIKHISDAATERFEESDHRRRILNECLSKLRREDRELVQRRYAPGESGKGIAKQLGRPVNSVYQSLGRIRRTLLECVNRHLSADAAGHGI